MTATKRHRQKLASTNVLLKLLNDPHFVRKCELRDPELIRQLHSLADLPKEQLGEFARDAFDKTSNTNAGKFIKALTYAMTGTAVGSIMLTIFENCEMPKT